jgi:ubiquinone/menaquinone biosynthesis C-methylase UbiE
MDYPDDFFYRWFPGELNHHTGFHRVVSAALPAKGKILDVGCGDNDLLTAYRTNNREVWGADFGVHPALKHAAWFRPLRADGTIPFADNTFEFVTSFMVMEHVAEPASFLAEIARVLKPGGLYVGQSIHAIHYVTLIRRLFDLAPHSWVQRLVKKLYGREEHDTFPTCYRLNTQRAITRAARAADLTCVDWRSYSSQGYFLFSPLLCRMAVLVDWALEQYHAGLGRIYFTVVLRKPNPAPATREPLIAARAA